MKYLICLLLFFWIIIPKESIAQNTSNDTITRKDTTIGQKLKALVQFVIKDTVARKEREQDTLREMEFDGKIYSFHQFRHETFLFAEAPAKWHNKDWLRVGLVIVFVSASIPFDQDISNVTQGHQNNYYVLPVVLGRIYGSWYFNAITIGASVGYTIYTHNTEAKKIDIELIQAGIYTALISQALKFGIGRSSPYNNRGVFNFRPFKFQKAFESMPNGGTASAFALSTITYRHAKSTLFKALAYVPAAFTLFSGIYQNTHWLSDELLGAAIGFSTGMWVVTLHEGKRHKINISQLN